MKTEEATCKVAPSPTQISYPLYNVKDGVIEDSPHTGVTYSPCSIESPQKFYITPPPEEQKKSKDPRYACLGYVQKIKGIPPRANNILTYFVMARQWRPDRLIIIGYDEVAEKFGLSRRQVIRLIKSLIENNCLRLFKRGGIKGGTKYEANTYALGSIFDNLPPEEPKWRRSVTKMSPIKGSPSVTKMSIEQCQECHPLPIVPPIHTHTKELPSAFNKENWAKECQRLNPSRDLKDIERTFPLALRKGAKDGDWMHWVEYFDSFYTPPSGTKRSFPAPRPAVKSSCESPKQAPLDYDNPKVLDDQLYDALRNGVNPSFIIASVKDPALAQSALAKAEARLETSSNRSRMP
jgi:hypothetical protein